MRRCLFLVALLAACDGPGPEGPDLDLECPTEAPTPSPRAPSSGRSRLVYAVAVDEKPQLFMIDLDAATPEPVRLDAVGTAPGPLLVNWDAALEGIWSPPGVWSPAGNLVAVRLASGALSVIDVNAPGAIRDIGLPASVDAPNPEHGELGLDVWSPDGDRIVTLDPVQQRVRVAQADGSGTIDLFAGLGEMHHPSWAPDGRHVGVSVAGTDRPDRLFVTPADDDAPRFAAQAIYWWGIAGAQVLNAYGNGRWRVADVESGESSEVAVDIDGFSGSARNYTPTFSLDGSWMFVPGASPHMQRWGCQETATFDSEPAWAGDAVPTSDGRYIVFTGPDPTNASDRSSAWAAKRLPDGSWHTFVVFTPTSDPIYRVQDPIVARTGSRAAWRVGSIENGDFVVTDENLLDPAMFRAEGLRVTDLERLYWFSPELDRIAWVVDDARQILRVKDVSDPSAATLVGELAVPSNRLIVWAAWSSDGNALAFAATDPTLGTYDIDMYVTRIENGALEPPRLLGTTGYDGRTAFQWEP